MERHTSPWHFAAKPAAMRHKRLCTAQPGAKDIRKAEQTLGTASCTSGLPFSTRNDGWGGIVTFLL